MTITVVTPWLGHPELLPAYSAAMVAGHPDALVIIDNGDFPGMAAKAKLPAETRLIHYPMNVGFARSCNAGLEDATTDAVLFLNNDVVATVPSWLDSIREELRPGVLVGASLITAPHAAVDGRPMPYLDGWCIAGMREDLLALGGWDEDLEEPSYYGDNVLCAKAKARGMKLVQANVGLRHINGVTRRDFPEADAVAARNRERYVAKVRALRVAA